MTDNFKSLVTLEEVEEYISLTNKISIAALAIVNHATKCLFMEIAGEARNPWEYSILSICVDEHVLNIDYWIPASDISLVFETCVESLTDFDTWAAKRMQNAIGGWHENDMDVEKRNKSDDDCGKYIDSFKPDTRLRSLCVEELRRNPERPEYVSEYMKDLVNRGIDVSMYPCEHMAYYLNPKCDQHSDDLSQCPDSIIVKGRDSSIFIRHPDMISVYSISYCPWCGETL